MIEKCAISNINNNMQFIGLIILLLILCIVLLYYIKISSKTHNEIIEKYNNGSIPSSVNKSPYLNTSGRSPELQNTSDGHKDARYPTSNNAKISTATLRPCQIHFNDEVIGKDIITHGLDKQIFFKKDDGSVWIDLSDEGLERVRANADYLVPNIREYSDDVDKSYAFSTNYDDYPSHSVENFILSNTDGFYYPEDYFYRLN